MNKDEYISRPILINTISARLKKASNSPLDLNGEYYTRQGLTMWFIDLLDEFGLLESKHGGDALYYKKIKKENINEERSD